MHTKFKKELVLKLTKFLHYTLTKKYNCKTWKTIEGYTFIRLYLLFTLENCYNLKWIFKQEEHPNPDINDAKLKNKETALQIFKIKNS